MKEISYLQAVSSATWSDGDAELVALAQRKPEAFAALYDRYIEPIYRYLYSRLGSAADAEDLSSQVFLSALEKLPGYRHRGYFSAWLFTIARNVAIDHFRRKKSVALPETFDPPDGVPDLLAQAVHAEEVSRLRSLIRALPEEDQEVIRLRFTAQLTFAEIAAIFNRSEGAIKKQVYRLLARLESQMEGCHD